jgi:hypothetical protein
VSHPMHIKKKRTPKSKTTKSVLERYDRAARSMAKAMTGALDAGYQPGFPIQRSIDMAGDDAMKKPGVSKEEKARVAKIVAKAKKAVRK